MGVTNYINSYKVCCYSPPTYLLRGRPWILFTSLREADDVYLEDAGRTRVDRLES